MNFWKKCKPILGLVPALLTALCVVVSLTSYTAPVLTVELASTNEEVLVETTSETEETSSMQSQVQTKTETKTMALTSETAQKLAEIVETGGYVDGVYTGTGTGFRGKITVQVTISDGDIASILVLSSEDDEPYFTNASALLSDIIAKQSTNVDTVSGATYSSNGLIEAVRNALSQAGGDTSTVAVTTTQSISSGEQNNTNHTTASTLPSDMYASGKYVDGTYTGTGTGFGGLLTVQVVISDGEITSIEVLHSEDDEPYLTNATALFQTILSQQNTDVDTISGATYSSAGLIAAVQDALTKALLVEDGETVTVTSTKKQTTTTTTTVTKATKATISINEDVSSGKYPYPDGTYTGTGEGFRGDITLEVTLKSGYLTAIEIISTEDDEPYFSNASALIQTILSDQSVDVDAVSGATFSSIGILDAVADALDAAQQASSTVTTIASTTAIVTTTSTTKVAANTEVSGTTNETQTTALTTTDTPIYLDGTYIGTATCEPDASEDFEAYDLSLEVIIENDMILSITNVTGTGDNYDTENDWYIDRAANGTSKYVGVVAQILEAASVSNEIDAVSGATCSSEAIVAAVEDALEQAKLT